LIVKWLAVLTVATTVFTLQAGIPPAGAATRTVALEEGNAAAAIDLVGARVRNGEDELRFVLWVADLGASGRFEFHWDRSIGEGFHEQTWVHVRRTDTATKTVIEYSDGRDADIETCPGSDTRWQAGRDRVLIVIPSDCTAAPHGTAATFDARVRGLGDRDRMPSVAVSRG